jgi:hypothetical protein
VHTEAVEKQMHRIAVCLLSMEVQGGRPHIRVVLNPDSPKRSAQQLPLTFADVDAALAVIHEFAEKWRDDAHLTGDKP